MLKKTLLLLVLTLALAGCSNNDPFEDYLGLWELQDSGKKKEKVLEITRDGETLLINENVLRGGKPTVMKKSDGQLSVSAGFADFPLGLSENRDILRFADGTYKRIDVERLKEVKVEAKYNMAIHTMKYALDLYRLDTGHYPTEEEGLRVLLQPENNQKPWLDLTALDMAMDEIIATFDYRLIDNDPKITIKKK